MWIRLVPINPSTFRCDGLPKGPEWIQERHETYAHLCVLPSAFDTDLSSKSLVLNALNIVMLPPCISGGGANQVYVCVCVTVSSNNLY